MCSVEVNPEKAGWKYSMAFRDDPAHAWIPDSWAGQPIDPRVPMTSHLGRT